MAAIPVLLSRPSSAGPYDIFHNVPNVIRVSPFPRTRPRSVHQGPLASAAPHTTCSGPPTQSPRTQRKGPTEGTSTVNGSHSVPRQPAVQHHIRPVFLYPPSRMPWRLHRAPPCAAGSVVLHACPTVYVRCSSGTPRPRPSHTFFFFFPFAGAELEGWGGRVVHAPHAHMFPFRRSGSTHSELPCPFSDLHLSPDLPMLPCVSR